MKKFLLLFVFCTGLFAGRAQTVSENLFYMTDSPDGWESLRRNISQISVVCPQTFKVSADGIITGSLDARVLELAKANGVRVVPLIINAGNGFDMDLLGQLVNDPAARKRSIDMMVDYARQYGIDGWQFDLEHLHVKDRDAFTQYYREAAVEFRRNGLELSAAIIHLTDNTGGAGAYQKFLFEEWRGGFDVKALAEIGDFLSIMTYDQHTRRTTPGPVAALDWVERVIGYVLSEGVPAEKISLGIPSYSMHWYTDYSAERGGFQNWRSVNARGVEYMLQKYGTQTTWHPKAACHYAVWDNDGVWEYLFIEDERSFEAKLSVLEKYGLRGISVWVLGTEHAGLWDVLARKTVRK